MKPTILWIVGEPGVGKTTLSRRLILSIGGEPLSERASPKFTFYERMAAAGWWRGDKFDGADTLAISQIKPALAVTSAMLRLGDTPLVLLDGDKLSSGKAVEFLRGECPAVRLVCVALDAKPETAAARRAQRGTKQDPTWVAGRRTKAANFAARFPGEVLRISAETDTDVQVALVKGLLGVQPSEA